MESGVGLMLFLMKSFIFVGFSWIGMKVLRDFYEKYPFKRFKKEDCEPCEGECEPCEESCCLQESDIVGYAPEEDDLP